MNRIGQRPIIVTVQLDASSAGFFQEQREKHFPAHINYIDAHLTMFHNLPGVQFEKVLKTIGRCCAARASFKISVVGLMRLGRGVAYDLQSQELNCLRAELADNFAP